MIAHLPDAAWLKLQNARKDAGLTEAEMLAAMIEAYEPEKEA